jgi:hypothetical protein
MATKIPNDFYIEHDKFQELSDKSTNWFIKSFDCKFDGYEFQICRLKSKMYFRDALVHLKKANKLLNHE